MRVKIMRAIRAVSFICLTVACIVASSYALAPKGNKSKDGIHNPTAHGFLSEPENSLDIFMIGNSDAYSGFSPMELWNAYGYTSYVCGEGRQSPAGSFAILQEVYKCQKPKLVIMETDNFFASSKSLTSMAILLNAKLGSPFSVFVNHNRWETLKFEDILKKPNYTAHCIPKGQWVSNASEGYFGKEYMQKTNKATPIGEMNQQSLESFIDLCKKNGSKVLLVQIPSAVSWNYKRHNAVKRFADDHKLPFLDFDLERSEGNTTGFNWAKDSRDGGNHLNNSGAKKITLAIGKYISENYDIQDKSKDPEYQIWHDDYKEYQKMLKIKDDF